MRRGDPELLLRLTEAVFDAKRGRLVTLRAEEEALHRTIRGLERPLRAPGPEIDPARRAGADLLWQGWADTRRRALLAELARLRVEIDKAIEELRPAFGRREAARRMVENARQARARAASRRVERP
ncbi:hypothetical protein [Limimaricola sp. AA108-03]|uniref:hypothetical protein n=1 Tax=Limimaricola sp. AA108-03 TaxID=3425945 RepID=UPI003D77641D